MKRAILVSGKASLNQEIKSMLPLANYQLLASTDNGMEALRFIHRYEPDLVIMGWNLRGLSSSEVLQNLVLQHLCPIVVVLTQEEHYVLPEVIEADAHHVIVYPSRVLEMVAGIQMAEHRYQRESEHYQQVQRIEEELKTRKIIFQALLCIIQKRGVTEQEAYKSLRDQAMSTRKSMRTVAQEVLKGVWLPA
ncbi:response regulator with putative antiterminator output domain [Desulfosporosinus acidiphilus SJ4]|uniref:Stage 0 sporulation protein A homolog n=1 Tax=Desulfosporosinus acidiphilus (strain DSM 22704 / JCM 16185 / SJ4) TaxID=646529 RepID=I4D7U4_DESAJ|nr:ANTAR domain-containing protein [Desulfosporosinus acidiphilus]AFM41868.1 response regulator with putative antiterminator output domain [Desulfosporosinus acidiphilus SJ4]